MAANWSYKYSYYNITHMCTTYMVQIHNVDVKEENVANRQCGHESHWTKEQSESNILNIL